MQFILSFWNCINYVLRVFSFTCFSRLLAVTDNSWFTACLKLATCLFFQVEQFFLCTSPTCLLNYMITKAGETCWVQYYSGNCISQVSLENASKAHGAESAYLLYFCVCKYSSLPVKEMKGLCTIIWIVFVTQLGSSSAFQSFYPLDIFYELFALS